MSHKWIVGALFGAGLALAASPASAVDFKGFVRCMEAAGLHGLTYLGGAKAVGETVVIDGLGFDLGPTMIILEGQFTFAGITMLPDGSYRVASITAPEIVFRDQSTGTATATLNDLSFTGAVVPGKAGAEDRFHPTALRTGMVTWLEFPLTADAFSMVIQPTYAEEDIADLAMSMGARSLTLHLPDEPTHSGDMIGTLSALRVDELTLDIDESFTWQNDGTLNYSSRTGLGQFGTSQTELVINGLTQAKLDELLPLWTAALASNWQDANAQEALVNALLGLSIEAGGIRYDAGRLFPQLLNYLAISQGGRKALAAQLEQFIMADIDALAIPPLAALVRQALRTFLAEPYSLEIRLDPPAPVTFISLSAAAMIDKAGFMPLLGLTVTANEPPRP